MNEAATSKPRPHKGWSREISVVRDALVVPPENDGQEFGVWGPSGDCLEAATWRDDKRLAEPVRRPPESTEYLRGRHLWGGVFYGHFGHFIVELISRLWAASRCEYDSIVFVPRHGALKDFRGYQSEMIDLLVPNRRVNIVRQPVKVEELHVAGQGFGLGKISAGTPEFNAMISNMAETIVADGPSKIYISRTRFNGNGGVLAEHVIEENMIANGYTPVYPETMSILQQLTLFKAATKIVGLDGSAFHLLGYVARPEQEVCLVIRRSHKAYLHLVSQLQSSLAKSLAVTNVVTADWMPERQKMANHISWGELDHTLLASELAVNGFIRAASEWRHPTAIEFGCAVEAAAKKMKSDIVRRAVKSSVGIAL